ncbi:unnamed protein product [Closterium sp. NIES-54]
MPKERQVAASISTKGEAVGSSDGANGRAKEIKSKKCNLGNEMVAGIRVKGEPDEVLGCSTCMQAKFTRYPFSSSEATAKAPLDEVVMDVVGPLKFGAAGAEYFLTIVDVYTRMTWVYVLSKKSDVAETVKTDWLPMVERQQDRLVKAIRTDRGGEFLRKEFSLWLKKNGIRHSLTMPYSPAMNGIAERANRTITETARGLLIEAGLPEYFWPDAVRSACVAKNKALTHVGADKWVPYVEWIGRKPKVDMLRVFGCMCMALVPKHLRHNKLGAKAIWAVHLGMAQNSKGWLLWDPFTKKLLQHHHKAIFKMDNIFDQYDLLEVMEGTEKRPENDPEKSPVHIPATAAVAVVLERQMAALRIEEDEAVEEGVQKFFDLLTRLEGADLNYSELQKKTKLLALLPESLSSLIINLNRDLPRISLEDVKRAILQEDFRRRELASADGAGAASIGHGYGRGRGRGRGGGRFGGSNYNGGRGSSGYGNDNKNNGLADGLTASVIFATRADTCGAIATNSLMDGLLLKAKRVEEQEEGEEEAVEAVAVAEAMFKGADGKMVGLKNVLWVPNLAANLISVQRLQKAGMDTSSKGAKTYTARLGERILWDLHEDRDVYNEMWQISVVPMPKERQVAASISTKGEAVVSGDGTNGRAKEIKSKKCNLGGTSKLGEHEESGAAFQKQHKGEENPKAAAEEEYGENMWGTIASAAFSNLTSATGECDWLTLHRRLGHVALPILQQLVKNEMVAGIRVKGEPDEVVGPLKLGAAGAEYFLTIADVYTRMTWVYVLSKKSDVLKR